MKYDFSNWPFKWYGLWKEYGEPYKNYPSIKAFINPKIKSKYNWEKLNKYLNDGVTVATTSHLSFPSPFDGSLRYGSVSFKTDGQWLWLDNIVEFIEYKDLIIPEKWYQEIISNNFIINTINQNQIQELEWPNL